MRINLLAGCYSFLPGRKINLLKNYSHRRISSSRINLLEDYRRPRQSMSFIVLALLGTAVVLAGITGLASVLAGLFIFELVVLTVIRPLFLKPVYVSTRSYTRPAHYL